MAQDKKSFIGYADWGDTFEMLDDAEAGKLIKHIFKYIRDENPFTEDKLLQLAFNPIKLQLKRDLVKYEFKRNKWSEAGKKSAAIKAAQKESTNVDEKSTTLKHLEPPSTDSTVNDNVNVNGNGNVIQEEMPLGHEMQKLFISVNPKYPQKPSKDIPAIMEIACFIHENNGYKPKQMFEMDVGERKNVLSEWKKWCEWYKINGSNRDLSFLAQFKMQNIAMELKNGKPKQNFGLPEIPAYQQQCQPPAKKL